MGRAKIAMELIQKDKAQNITFDKRKNGIMKKAHELKTLCDVPVCVLIYKGPTSEPNTFPPDREEVLSVINRYDSVPKEESSKRSLNLQGVLESGKKKADHDHDQQQQLSKLQKKNNAASSYPTWMPDLDGCTKEDLLRLVSDLDYKMQAVQERIGGLRGNFGNHGGYGNAIVNTNGGGDVQIDVGSSIAPYPYYDPNVYSGSVRFEFDRQMGSWYEEGKLFY